MKVCGIIAEFNPFHFGHEHCVSAAREIGSTHVVAVMSGNFVQRGGAAVCDKFARAQAALCGGVDLVLELPLPFATATAQRFAKGAVGTLHALGCVEQLCFGSESGNTAAIAELAAAIESEAVTARLKAGLGTGLPFAAARQAAVREVCGDSAAELLSGANDTLAVEYAAAVNALGGKMKLNAVPRLGAAHDGAPVGGIASASHLRALAAEGELAAALRFMPKASADLLVREVEAGRAPADLRRVESASLAALRKMSVGQLAALPDVSEGLENRLFRAIRQARSTDEVIALTKSKRYTHARLRRILLCALLGITREIYCSEVPYIRVLAMNARGREVLAAAKPTLPVLTRAKDKSALDKHALDVLQLECTADDIYALCCPTVQPCSDPFGRGIVIK